MFSNDVGNQARIEVNFDFNWKFFKGDVPGPEDADFTDANWKSINLPHDWSIAGPFSKDNPSGSSGGYLPGGIGWYKKSFQLPEDYKDKKIFIEFDGVYMNSEVWINGHHLGNHPYGYTSFYYDITPYLRYGDSKNVLTVRVDNSKQPNSRWYSGSGIYRHVWLLITDKLHVDHWGTFVTTPEVSKESATVEIKTRIENETDASEQVNLMTSIVDKDNKVVKIIETSQEIQGNSEYEFVQRTEIKNPNLWSPDSPYLYGVYTTVKDGKRIVDNYETPLGIRQFHFDANRGFFLNGENMKIKGVCLHHDCGCLGAACPDRANERRIEILKQIGCNAIRTSHNPPAPELLDYCDRYGLLVMDEAFDEWEKGKTEYGYHEYFGEWAVKDLKNMIHRDRNHPSVIIWSVGNEIPEQDSAEGVKILRKLVELVHEEDPSRPVTSACNDIEAANKTGFADLLDVVGYNYGERFYEEDHKRYPDRKIIGSETVDYPVSVWLANEKNDYVAGEFLWTGFDYLGESGIGGSQGGPKSWLTRPEWPCRSSMCGLIDLSGFKKPRCYFRQSLWSIDPMVYIACQIPPSSEQDGQLEVVPLWGWPKVVSHWNWPGKEGKTITVSCYTNCESVELFLNRKSLGSKELSSSSDLQPSWDVLYKPGTLKAIGKKDGKIVANYELHTAGKPAKIVLIPNRDTMVADARDLCHIEVNVVDKDGKIAPDVDNLITFNISGEGKIIGVGSGDPQSHEDYKSNKRKAYNGKCLAVVQSTCQSGQICITATSPGLTQSSITSEARNIRHF